MLLRHGQSTWNRANRFTGWIDVPLTSRGESEAVAAGRVLADECREFDVAFTSVLKRSIKTLWIALEELDQMWIPIEQSWRLNERHYGALQGLDKAEVARRHGREKTELWRRAYDVRPPSLAAEDPANPALDRRYQGLEPQEIPLTESLADTELRLLPFWHERIAPALHAGRRVLVAAHGNSLRALVKFLEGIGDAEIAALNIPMAIPLVYELGPDLRPLSRRYLADPETVREAERAIARATEV